MKIVCLIFVKNFANPLNGNESVVPLWEGASLTFVFFFYNTIVKLFLSFHIGIDINLGIKLKTGSKVKGKNKEKI